MGQRDEIPSGQVLRFIMIVVLWTYKIVVSHCMQGSMFIFDLIVFGVDYI